MSNCSNKKPIKNTRPDPDTHAAKLQTARMHNADDTPARLGRTTPDAREIRKTLLIVARKALDLRREARAAVPQLDAYQLDAVRRFVDSAQDALEDVEVML